MTAMILAVQVALPLALIGWLAFLPAGSLAGFALQAAGMGRSCSRWRAWRNGRSRSGGCHGFMAGFGWPLFWSGRCVRA